MVHFNVSFKYFNSFADITLSLAKTLELKGIPISVESSPVSAQGYSVFTEEEKNLIELWMSRPPSELFQIKWSHYWRPHFFQQQKGQVNLQFFAINYEFDRNDEEFDFWMQDAVTNSAHLVAVSHFCRDVLLKAGCPSEKVSVLPLGYNPLISELYDQKNALRLEENTDVKIILHMTNTFDLYRFGTDVLLQAFCAEFKDESTVGLFIKDGGKHYELIVKIIEEIKQKQGYFKCRIVLIPQVMTKQKMASLYLTADALAAPFRGEGFAIKILDGFAAGLPVAMPLYGGPGDYANDSNCYPVSYQRVPLGHCYDRQHLQLTNSPYWAEPDVDSLREQLRNIIEHPQRFKVAQKARETAEKLSWDATGQKLLKLMRHLF